MAQNECTRCGNVWVSRKDNPKQCSRCKSPYWNKEKLQLKHEWG